MLTAARCAYSSTPAARCRARRSRWRPWPRPAWSSPPTGGWPPAIIAFSGGVTVLQAQGTRRAPGELVDDLVALRGHGVTDMAAALRAAAAELAWAAADERVAVLLSDCLPTTGGDPALALAGISRLHVLCPLPTAEAERAAAELARRGGGVCQPVRRVTDVAPAL